MAYIELHDVVKDFKIKNRRNGAFGNVKNFFAPQYLTKRAVDHISLEINRGEMVGIYRSEWSGQIYDNQNTHGYSVAHQRLCKSW